MRTLLVALLLSIPLLAWPPTPRAEDGAVCAPACQCLCPPTGLDDQDCYQTPRRNSFRPAIALTIHDQFGTLQANAVNFHRLCAPTDKNGDCPLCPRQPDHYLGLTLAQVTGTVTTPHVSLAYQFGTLSGDVGSVVGGPGFLLTPAGKSLVPPPPAPPPGLHNYNCYRLVNPTGDRTGSATVTDQFVMDFPLKLDPGGPWTLCVGADVNGTDPGAVGVESGVPVQPGERHASAVQPGDRVRRHAAHGRCDRDDHALRRPVHARHAAVSAKAKTYLGDAVYAEVVDGELVLTTEDGLHVTNRIVLEAVVWQALRHYMGLPDLMRRYVGIDVGVTGAFAVLDVHADGRQELQVEPTPVNWVQVGSGKRRRYDPTALYLVLDKYRRPGISLAYLEHQSARPGQGTVSMFSTGFGFGLWVGTLNAMLIPYVTVSPVRWRARVGLAAQPRAEKKAIKQGVRLAACRRFPGVPIRWITPTRSCSPSPRRSNTRPPAPPASREEDRHDDA